MKKYLKRLLFYRHISKPPVFWQCLLLFPSLYRSIKRIIFNSLVKPNVNEKGEKHMEPISTSQALQIAGRAGRSVSGLLAWFLFGVGQWFWFGFTLSSLITTRRFSSKFKEGEVTTLHRDDLPVLKEILSHPVDPIEVNVHTGLLNALVVGHNLSHFARSLFKNCKAPLTCISLCSLNA